MMNLAAIYNVFDGEEFLRRSILSVRDSVDYVIAICQERGNGGERYLGGVGEAEALFDEGLIDHIFHFVPARVPAMKNERTKRERGIRIAREMGYSHYVFIDCDEMYEPGAFEAAKHLHIAAGCQASVMRIDVFFGREDLRFSRPDKTLVPFIAPTSLPLGRGPYYTDPTRTPATRDVFLIESIRMQHYSWVRSDEGIARKVLNSSARKNIERCGILDYWRRAEAGLFVEPIFSDVLVGV